MTTQVVKSINDIFHRMEAGRIDGRMVMRLQQLAHGKPERFQQMSL